MSEKNDNNPQPVFLHVEPVLAVKNVLETVAYWHEVLGFPNKWTWDEPPNHGGVSWDSTSVQFSLNPVLAAASVGNSIWIRVKNLELLYALHQEKNANIVSPLENKPWGMAEYVIQEINGYYVCFSTPSTREKGEENPVQTMRIIRRKPTASEYRRLVSAVGWSALTNDAIVESLLASVAFSVLAEDPQSGDVVGCAFVLGDSVSFYYVKDVMVHPDWQGKHVGTALMQELTVWVEANAEDNVLVGLFTGENLAPFYKQFGFTPAYGMYRRIRRNLKDT